jgi:hypothetical protein
MAVPKFYRILRGQRGNAAKQKFLNHLEGLDTESAIGTKGNRAASTELLIVPFGVKLGATVLLEQSALETSWAILKGPIGTHATETIPQASTSVKLRGARAARISATSGLSATGTVKTSKLTGLKYADYGGKSVSAPFGKTSYTSTDVETDVYEVIKVSLPSNTYKRIHLIQERI